MGDGDGGVELTSIGSFSSPLFVTQPPGERSALYVVEQGGRVVRQPPGGEASTFLDISGEITSGGEQGLLSIAFAPDFADSGLLYANFTDTSGDTRVAEFRSADGGRTADPATRRDILRIEQPYANHNGGLVLFGPDDLLYIGTGDGGSADDPDRSAQDLGSLLGKLLRVDPAAAGDRPYSIPGDNPFRGENGARAEIYSYGLRNPWRFSFDRNTGDLSIGDVGQNSFEEVTIVPAGEGAGANFGWSAFEGETRFNSDQEAPGHVEPSLVYATSGGNCSVTGGEIVRDERLTSLYGRYLYGDFCLGQLRSFVPRAGQAATDDKALGPTVENLSSFGTDTRGRIYATSLSGEVFRIDPS